jgi:tetrahydromethanopterin S-methyltransferase subunit B
MPVVEHEEHMAFQKTEDALGNKIDLLDQKVDGFKKTLDADHTDVEGLKETRTVVKVWGSVLVAAWSLVLFLGFKEKLVALFHRIVGVQGVLSNGAIAINADAASSTKTPPPPQE